MTGEASAHAQHKFGAVKVDFVAYNKLTTGLRHDLGIFARLSKFRCFHETKQTQNEVNLAGFVFEYSSPTKCFDLKRFHKILPLLPIVIAKSR